MWLSMGRIEWVKVHRYLLQTFQSMAMNLLAWQFQVARHLTILISLSIECDGQEETDRLWNAITKEGKAGQCGWCVDKFGVSWQVSSKQMREHLGNPDPVKADYAMQAMRKMGKIVIRDLYA
jgi:predicted 3-demethylubiquinone-9 3-methyltransferase (glyoxalase superfamily)